MDVIDFRGISFVVDTPSLRPIPIQNLEIMEDRLGLFFPEDYREFITTFGSGETDFHLRALNPQAINSYIFEVRSRFSESLSSEDRSWYYNPNVLTLAYAIECVPFFDGIDGDDILFHPSKPNEWFILPHEEEEVFLIHSFQELCDFYLRRYSDLHSPYHFYPYDELPQNIYLNK
jgi:hypothetical protein